MRVHYLAAILMSISVAAPASFTNGDFEQGIDVGWTLVSGKATTVTGEQGDPDAEGYVHSFSVNEPILGIVQSDGQSAITGVGIPIDRLRYFAFSYYANSFGLGDVQVVFTLLSESGGFLDIRSVSQSVLDNLAGVVGWKRVRVDIMQWAADSGALIDDKVQVRVRVAAITAAPATAGTASAFVYIDDVEFEPYPTQVLNGDFENDFTGWDFFGNNSGPQTDADDDPDKEMVLIGALTSRRPVSTLSQVMRIDNEDQVLHFRARVFHQETRPADLAAITVRVLDRNGNLVGERVIPSTTTDTGWRDYVYPITNGLIPRGANPARPLALSFTAVADGTAIAGTSTVMLDDIRLEPARNPDGWMLE